MPSVAEACTARAWAEETALRPETPRSLEKRWQRDRGRGLPDEQEYLGLAKPHTHLKHDSNCNNLGHWVVTFTTPTYPGTTGKNFMKRKRGSLPNSPVMKISQKKANSLLGGSSTISICNHPGYAKTKKS